MMMPLYRAISRHGLAIAKTHHGVRLSDGTLLSETVMDGIRNAVRIDVQNVADYEGGTGEPPLRAMTGLVSPWPEAWCEFVSHDGVPLGALTLNGPIMDGGGEGREPQALRDAITVASGGKTTGLDLPTVVPDAGWVHATYVVSRVEEITSAPMLIGWSYWFCHPNGDPVLNPAGRFLQITQAPGIEDAPSLGAFMRYTTRIVTLACAFANCRNTALVESGGVWPSRQARRAAERAGEPPPTTYYTLRITPTMTRRSGLRPEISQRRDLPLHIVRGHFARYTEAAPLFGKHVGQFWIPAHVRGHTDAGRVVKDYAIETGSSRP